MPLVSVTIINGKSLNITSIHKSGRRFAYDRLATNYLTHCWHKRSAIVYVGETTALKKYMCVTHKPVLERWRCGRERTFCSRNLVFCPSHFLLDNFWLWFPWHRPVGRQFVWHEYLPALRDVRSAVNKKSGVELRRAAAVIILYRVYVSYCIMDLYYNKFRTGQRQCSELDVKKTDTNV